MKLADPPQGVQARSVSELTAQIKSLLEKGFCDVWVVGEVSNHCRASSGHNYLCLKDAGAQMRAVIWRSTASRLRLELYDGLEVLARGRLGVYAPRGEYQFMIEELYAQGAGAQDLALRQLLEKLQRLGYFAPERKKPLPRYPACVGLVTSPQGAAVRDMLEILGRRWPAAGVYVCPVRVQGPEAPGEIADALRLLNRLRCVDVVILGRGGGSSEDLAAFNQEVVARAIFESAIPVVSAVGHEIDVTVADRVADRRALTPSEAAELVTPDREELLKRLGDRARRLTDLLCQTVQVRRERLRVLADRRVFHRPLERLQDLERRLDEVDLRLTRAVRQRVALGRQTAEAFAARLETLSPLNVLARGYSLTRPAGGKTLIRQASQVRPGDRLETLLAEGKIVSRVEEAG